MAYNSPRKIGSVVTQTFTSSGTYTPTAGMIYCIIEVVGSGGGGGACNFNSAINQGSGGGGSGGYAKALYTATQIGASQVVTIAAAGTGGAAGNNVGLTGGTVSVGALISATGGVGGQPSNTAGISPVILGGAGGTGTVSSGTSIIASQGQYGNGGFPGNGVFSIVGGGASSRFGGGANPPTAQDSAGNNATGYGSGGSGSYGYAASRAGGNGSNGIVLITEFINN